MIEASKDHQPLLNMIASYHEANATVHQRTQKIQNGFLAMQETVSSVWKQQAKLNIEERKTGKIKNLEQEKAEQEQINMRVYAGYKALVDFEQSKKRGN